MLVLSRKVNEAIIINDNIEVLIVEMRGDKVRVGIEAPKDVIVHRKEVYLAIQAQAAHHIHISPQKKLEAVLRIGKQYSLSLSDFLSVNVFVDSLLNLAPLTDEHRADLLKYKADYLIH